MPAGYDDHTVTIKQSAGSALFLAVLTVYFKRLDRAEMRKYVTAEDPRGQICANTVGVSGFGPYRLERWLRDDEFVLRAKRGLTVRYRQAQLTQRLTAREFENLRNVRGVKVMASPATRRWSRG